MLQQTVRDSKPSVACIQPYIQTEGEAASGTDTFSRDEVELVQRLFTLADRPPSSFETSSQFTTIRRVTPMH
jgi:hypothetical protein